MDTGIKDGSRDGPVDLADRAVQLVITHGYFGEKMQPQLPIMFLF